MEQLEPDFGVFFFVVGGLFKEFADLDVTVFFGLGGVVTVLGVGLAFTGKGGQQVGFGFASFQFRHGDSSFKSGGHGGVPEIGNSLC